VWISPWKSSRFSWRDPDRLDLTEESPLGQRRCAEREARRSRPSCGRTRRSQRNGFPHEIQPLGISPWKSSRFSWRDPDRLDLTETPGPEGYLAICSLSTV